MLDPKVALEAASRPPRGHGPTPAARQAVLLVGGAGALGAAVLEQLLARSGGATKVGVAVRQPLGAALRGLVPVDDEPGALRAFGTQDAVIVFDRARHANGREEAFARPELHGLHALAQRLHAAGVRRLVLVLPQTMASLPQALQAGFASLDEQAVAAVGFTHVVLVRPSQAGPAAKGSSAPQRLALWLLSQLHLMVPQQQRPVRLARLAEFVAALALGLRSAPPGTRIASAELVWQAAQSGSPDAVASRWLAGEALPPARAPRQRL